MVSTSSVRKKKKTLTLKERIEVINSHEQKESARSIAGKFGVGEKVKELFRASTSTSLTFSEVPVLSDVPSVFEYHVRMYQSTKFISPPAFFR